MLAEWDAARGALFDLPREAPTHDALKRLLIAEKGLRDLLKYAEKRISDYIEEKKINEINRRK